ncbi:MAG: Mur ligase domain-containing protein, partial [Glutamicibacter sp.]
MVVQNPDTPRELERYLRPESIAGLGFDQLCGTAGAVRTGALLNAAPQILGVSLNPQIVQSGDVFLGISGAKRHGAEFVETAIGNGAVALITDTAGLEFLSDDLSIPVAVVADVRKSAAVIAQSVY